MVVWALAVAAAVAVVVVGDGAAGRLVMVRTR